MKNSLLLCAAVLVAGTGTAAAQTAVRVDPAQGGLGWLTHPYQTRSVPPINLANTTRLQALERAGNLYLASQDVVALAIENNIDVEVQRYGPLLAREVLKRAQAGGILRDVGVAVAQGPQSVSLQGVSVTSIGTTSAGTGVSSGGGIITQLGPPIPALDPSFNVLTVFQHITTPESNTFLVGTNALVVDTRTYQYQYSQNWSFGLTALGHLLQYTHQVEQRFLYVEPVSLRVTWTCS